MSDETEPGRRPENAEDPASALAVGEVIDAEFEDAEQGDLNADAADTPAEATPPASGRGLSAGLILLLAIVVVGALAAALWRPWRSDDAAASRADTAPVTLPAPASDVSEVDAGRESAPAEALAEEAPEEIADTAPDPSKIANTQALEDKTALDELATEENGGRTLPAPPSASGGNENLQRAAKDAAALFAEEASRSGEESDPRADDSGIRFELNEAVEDDETVAPDIDAETEEQALGDSPENALAALQDAAEAQAKAEARGEMAVAQVESAAAEHPLVEDSRDGPPVADNGSLAVQIVEAPADAGVEDNAPLSNAKISNNAGNANIDALAKDLAALKAMLTDENVRLSDELAAERSRTASLERELSAARAELKAKVENDATPRNALPPASSFAFVALTQKARAGAPYVRELALFRKSAPEAPGLDALAKFAETGAPTPGALKSGFDDAIRAALAADANAERRGVAAAMGERLSGLVSVRPAAPQEGMSAPAIISRAEARYAEGDLGAAADELESLEGQPAAAVAEWLARAEGRIEIDAALYELSTALAERAAQ